MREKLPAELEGELIASELTLSAGITGEDADDTRLLKNAAEHAASYLSSFSWCQQILESYFAGGVAGIFTIFFFRIRPGRKDVDPWIWIGVGDVPAAYLPLSDCKSAAEFFREYMEGMKRWVEFARRGQEGTAEQGVPPVNIPATPENAELLDRRLQVLPTLLNPLFDTETNIDIVN